MLKQRQGGQPRPPPLSAADAQGRHHALHQVTVSDLSCAAQRHSASRNQRPNVGPPGGGGWPARCRYPVQSGSGAAQVRPEELVGLDASLPGAK